MKIKLSWQLFKVGEKERPLPTVPASKATPKVLKALYKAVEHYEKTGEMLKEIEI